MWEDDGGERGREPARSALAFLVETDGGGQIILSAHAADGQRTRLSERTPAEELLRAVELDYTPLRDEVTRLWEAYPLDGTDRPAKKKELARLSEEVREASELLRETDPPGYFYITQRLAHERPSLDAALASEDVDLMEIGARLLNILEASALAQVRLRNMFEVAFDGTERATQRERYELLTTVYPSALDRYYPARRIAGVDDVPFSASRVEYRVEGPDERSSCGASDTTARWKQASRNRRARATGASAWRAAWTLTR